MTDYRARLASNDRARLLKSFRGTIETEGLEGLEGTLLKSNEAERITTGVLYIPDAPPDAQNEFTTEKTLRAAVENFMAKPIEERPAYVNHDRSRRAGSVISADLLWESVEFTKDSRRVTLPKGSVIATVKWDPWSWELVRSGAVAAYSMGGLAKRRRFE